MTAGRLKEILNSVPDETMIAVFNRKGGVNLVCGDAIFGSFEGAIPNMLKAEAEKASERKNKTRPKWAQVTEPDILILGQFFWPKPGTRDTGQLETQQPNNT